MTVIPWYSEKYAPVGRCIYSRPGEEHVAPFTDEHIIPFGLLPKGGDWFLPKSSCLACNNITKKFEDRCLRGMMGITRAKLDLKTRRKKARARPIDILFTKRAGGHETKQMDHRDLPHYFLGYKWPEPGIFRGQSPDSRDFHGEITVRSPKGELEKFIPGDGRGFRLATAISEMDFARMLAKIAHAYAFARCGPDTFDPMLLDFILGDAENASYLVGGDPAGPPPDQPDKLHDIYPVNCRIEPSGMEFLLVAIRLFAMVGMPRYHVVVGKQLKQLSLPKQQAPNG
jgi:hypothetical protein